MKRLSQGHMADSFESEQTTKALGPCSNVERQHSPHVRNEGKRNPIEINGVFGIDWARKKPSPACTYGVLGQGYVSTFCPVLVCALGCVNLEMGDCR